MINPFGEVSTVEVSSPNTQSDQALAQLENLEKVVSDISQSLENADLSGPYPVDKIMQLKEIMQELGAIIDSNDEPARSRAQSLKEKSDSVLAQFESRLSDYEYEQRLIADHQAAQQRAMEAER